MPLLILTTCYSCKRGLTSSRVVQKEAWLRGSSSTFFGFSTEAAPFETARARAAPAAAPTTPTVATFTMESELAMRKRRGFWVWLQGHCTLYFGKRLLSQTGERGVHALRLLVT